MVVVLALGEPGVGKTLTAEAYSEIMEKPLYSVQCSQLGTSPKGLEEALIKVLDRAKKWKAILLIDEADVYIRERGDDLEQNAIVGVLLRILEYFSGTMFMTTNREVICDDAIISRCIAKIRYPKPTQEEQIKIWKVMRDQFKTGMTDKDINTVVKKFPGLVGRDIKGLTKLANLVAKRNKKSVDAATVELVSAFQSLTPLEENKN